MNTDPRQPQTRAQWQAAVDLAEFYIRLDSARAYGLVSGGPEQIDVKRCSEILVEGRRKGVRPSPDCIQRLTMIHCEGSKR
jgi:hypothetical protein